MSSASVQELLGVGAGILPYVPLLLVAAFVISTVRSWYRLRHIQGPWLASVSSLWLLRSSFSGHQWKDTFEASRKYGSLVRIGPNDLLTDDPDIIKRMSGVRSPYTRSNFYDAMTVHPYLPNLLCERDTAKHDKLRAQMAAGYAGKENPTLEADIDDQISTLISLIKRKYISTGSVSRPLDFAVVAQYFTLDVITKISYGDAFGFLARDEDVHDYCKTIEETMAVVTASCNVPIFHKLFTKPLLKIAGPSAKDKTGIGKLMGVAAEVVATRFGPDAKSRSDMTGSFVRHGLTQTQCESEVLLQILAGSDTTAVAVRHTVMRLITTPTTLMSLRTEIDTAIAEARISSPITNAEGKMLPYLQAVIKESLRLHPPFTGLLLKEVPKQGDVLNGVFVPGGTRIAHSTWSMGRNSIFGPDADVFRPERWIEASEKQQDDMWRVAELVFGYGRWGCLGKSVALMELNKVFVELLRRFDFALIDATDPMKTWRSVNHNLFLQDNMWVRVTERTDLKGGIVAS
ncbi:cytochrome P450 [Saccharata proteae CBS 121410]|uniref:Cytochrome P450 monooxygenase ABA1 n=1 Tax=Saccharata proteae CBS 121410 TaxID=1314787 RepID=A0A9P4LWL1_9PEZI|nr:cytochrome P450 [Saccharata proteae CBS 121410]